MNQASFETCQTCGQQMPEGYVPVQDAKAIIRAFIVFDGGNNEWKEYGISSRWNSRTKKYEPTEGDDIPGILGKVKQVDTTGGMDKGTYASVVYEIAAPSGPRFFRIEGTYASHHGHDWDTDSFTEVFPREVIKYEWEIKK